MNLLLIKLTITPLLIASATLTARRWGQAVGGWLVGLPLTSGPVSLFLALEQGREFAAAATHSSLFGIVGVGFFCLIYSRCAERFSWPVTTLLTLILYLAVVGLLSWFSLPLWATFIITLLLLKVCLLLIGFPQVCRLNLSAPWWDLPLRMGAATVMVLAITGGASALGPAWSGLLAPFPVFTYVMVVFCHALYDPRAVRQLLRGVIIGSYAAAAFFTIVSVSVTTQPLAVVYTLAVFTALAVNTLTFTMLRRFAR